LSGFVSGPETPGVPPYEVLRAESPPASLLPVEFDLGAARAAIAALRTAADAVDRSARARVAASRDTEADWEGPQRRVFDQQERGLGGRASALVTELRRLAGDIADTAEAVRTENASRKAKLGEWQKGQDRLRERWVEAQRQRGAGA
jgi:hypothetical protein